VSRVTKPQWAWILQTALHWRTERSTAAKLDHFSLKAYFVFNNANLLIEPGDQRSFCCQHVKLVLAYKPLAKNGTRAGKKLDCIQICRDHFDDIKKGIPRVDSYPSNNQPLWRQTQQYRKQIVTITITLVIVTEIMQMCVLRWLAICTKQSTTLRDSRYLWEPLLTRTKYTNCA